MRKKAIPCRRPVSERCIDLPHSTLCFAFRFFRLPTLISVWYVQLCGHTQRMEDYLEKLKQRI